MTDVETGEVTGSARDVTRGTTRELVTLAEALDLKLLGAEKPAEREWKPAYTPGPPPTEVGSWFNLGAVVMSTISLDPLVLDTRVHLEYGWGYLSLVVAGGLNLAVGGLTSPLRTAPMVLAGPHETFGEDGRGFSLEMLVSCLTNNLHK